MAEDEAGEDVAAAEPAGDAPAGEEAGGGGGGSHKKWQPEARAAIPPNFSAGKPSKHSKEKLMAADGIIRIQSGTNKFSSQAGLTGFGRPRDVVDKVKCANLKDLNEEQVKKTKEIIPLQSGTNKFASQKGMTGFRTPRDVLYKPKGTGGVAEVAAEKAKISDGIIPLQSGTNKLASQAGQTGFGMPRPVAAQKLQPTQVPESQGFIHLQMGTNKFANQSGMTGFGMPRHNIGHYKDTVRGEMPHDESTLPRQTTGSHDCANQAGMTGFGAFRNTTITALSKQDRRSQGMIPYQMGINWGDSQAGKTGFGMPRQIYTAFSDDTRGELPEELSRAPDVPKWTGVVGYASQAGMTCIGMPRDVRGNYLRRMW